MLAFLCAAIVKHNNRQQITQREQKFPAECTENEIIKGYPFGEKYSLASGEFICVDASNTAVIALGDSLEFSGYTQDDRTIGPRGKAWGATRGWYIIKATKQTEVILYMDENIKVPESYDMRFEGYPNVRGTYHYVLSMKKHWSGFGYSDFEARSFDKQNPQNIEGDAQSEIIYILNPRKTSIKLKPKSEANIYPEPQGGVQVDKSLDINAELVGLQPLTNMDDLVKKDLELDKKYVSLVTFKYFHLGLPSFWPDINVELKGSDIFDENTESYSFLGHGKLTTFQIAIIVIVCSIVALAIIIGIIVCVCCTFCKCCKVCKEHCCCCCSCSCCSCCNCCSRGMQVESDEFDQKDYEK